MKYIGVATGQAVTKTATPLTCLRATDGIPNWLEIEKLIAEWDPEALIVGLPLNMDDTEQAMTACAKKFANRLQHKFKLPVHLVDERLTTWQVKQASSSKNFAKLNAEAAALIVAQWLNL